MFLRVWVQCDVRHHADGCHCHVDGPRHLVGLQVGVSCNLCCSIIISFHISVFRHWAGPDALYSLVGKDTLNNFRASLGDKDVIHVVQFTDPDGQDFCDRTLYMVAFVILTAGWSVDNHSLSFILD